MERRGIRNDGSKCNPGCTHPSPFHSHPSPVPPFSRHPSRLTSPHPSPLTLSAHPQEPEERDEVSIAVVGHAVSDGSELINTNGSVWVDLGAGSALVVTIYGYISAIYGCVAAIYGYVAAIYGFIAAIYGCTAAFCG
eukprot:1558834-Rhodomonas_salina.2